MASQYAYKKQCMDRAIYGNPQLSEFEGRQYCIPEKIQEYLTHIYGENYMELPPIEKRYRPYEYVHKIEYTNESRS